MLHIRSIDRAHIIYYSVKYDTTINGPYPMRPTHCLCLAGQKCRGRKMGMHSPHLHMQHNYLNPGVPAAPPKPHVHPMQSLKTKKSSGRGPFFPFPNNHLECILATCCYQVLAQAASLPRQPYAPTTFFSPSDHCHLPLHLIPAARIHPHLEPMATRCCRGTNATDQVNTRHRCT